MFCLFNGGEVLFVDSLFFSTFIRLIVYDYQSIINKQNSNISSKTDNSTSKNAIIALSVVLSVVLCSFILGCFIYKKYKKSPKKNLKYDLPVLMVTSKVPTVNENQEYRISQDRYLLHQTETHGFGLNGNEINLQIENNYHQKNLENSPELKHDQKSESNQENHEKSREVIENKEEFFKQDENNEENYEKKIENVVLHNGKYQTEEPKEKIDILTFDD